MSHPPSALRALAARAGIMDSYVDQTGREIRHTSDDARQALLCAMGFAASGETEARRTLEAWTAREQDALLPPVRVARGSEDAREIAVRVPGARRGAVGWQLAQSLPGGGDAERTGRSTPDQEGRLRLQLPVVPEPGYHRIHLRLHYASEHPPAEQTLIVAPRTCPPARERLRRPVFGLAANLYAVRSARNWGVGDLADVATLARWVAGHGGAFLGLNPLHALRNAGGDISPYRPVSRIYRNPLYLDVEAVPELVDSPEARRIVSSAGTRAELESLRQARSLDYDRVWALKSRMLDALYATFRERHLAHATPRAAAFRDYVGREGPALDEHATFLALEEWLRARGHQGTWHAWPEELRRPHSPAVREFREGQSDNIDRHRWRQFELDRQVGQAAAAAGEAGLSVGLYQDLAIGCSPDGSDAWANQSLLLHDISLGAPPDQYSANGQNWGLPPLNPHVLAEQRYEYWIALVRAALRHGGALRIDHILGLFRQFWIPAGRGGADGAYVRFPTQDLLGILALEATHAGAIIVGEDLGTVPPEVPPTLRDWEILGTKVMYFEREDEVAFKPAAEYEELALTVADTHDQVPLAGFWKGRDIAIRRATGLLDERAADQAQRDRARERAALVERLRAEGGLAESKPDAHAIIRSAHEFLCATPSVMVAFSLEDVAGETEPVNVPGVDQEAYPSWTRRLAQPLETLERDRATTERLTACEARAPD